jgi:hypothetical protein
MHNDPTDEERTYLEMLLETTHTERIHELHHTDTAAFKQVLLDELAVIERLKAKVVE